jgi:hypothetical protein
VNRHDLLLLKDVGKLAVAAVAAGIVCLLVRSLMMTSNPRPLFVLIACAGSFAAVYLPAMLLLRVPTSDEREKVRRGVERLQQFVYLRRYA